MAQLSPEARKRLTDAESALQEKWGDVAGKLMAAYAAAQFIEGTACSEHTVPVLMSIIEGLYASIVPKMYPEGRDAITKDLDELLVKIFAEHFPGYKFSSLCEEGGDLIIGSKEEDQPPGTLH